MTIKSSKRVAVASCHDKINFGSVLQSYATQRALEELGVEVNTIDKRGLSRAISAGRNDYYLEHLFDIDLYRAKLGFVKHRIKQKVDADFGKKMTKRKSAFSSFESTHFSFTPQATSFEDLGALVADYDSVVVGSDQLWLPVNIAGGYFTLSFVQPPVRKVSYSTSFGVSSLPEKYIRKTKEFLSDFSAISVREDTGADLVEKATGKRCAVVCDPTMLLTGNQWANLADSSSINVPDEPYVFCYFMGKNAWNRECALELARQHDLKIVAIAHPDEYVKADDDYADYYPWEAGPAEWVNLIAHASYVCTDSFHGSVFSNIFEVPFFSFRRHENMGAQSTNSRIDTLLRVLGNSDRICESKDAFHTAMASEIDFASGRHRLDAYRNESANWLKSALEL